MDEFEWKQASDKKVSIDNILILTLYFMIRYITISTIIIKVKTYLMW